jgi:hypothetical protein
MIRRSARGRFDLPVLHFAGRGMLRPTAIRASATATFSDPVLTVLFQVCAIAGFLRLLDVPAMLTEALPPILHPCEQTLLLVDSDLLGFDHFVSFHSKGRVQA